METLLPTSITKGLSDNLCCFDREEKSVMAKVQQYKLGDNNGVYSVQISGDGSKAAVGLGSGSVQVRGHQELLLQIFLGFHYCFITVWIGQNCKKSIRVNSLILSFSYNGVGGVLLVLKLPFPYNWVSNKKSGTFGLSYSLCKHISDKLIF